MRLRRALVWLDKKVAWLLGWSGRYTISAECGAKLPPFHRYCILCRILRKISLKHCEDQAKAELDKS